MDGIGLEKQVGIVTGWELSVFVVLQYWVFGTCFRSEICW